MQPIILDENAAILAHPDTFEIKYINFFFLLKFLFFLHYIIFFYILKLFFEFLSVRVGVR